jgi:quinol-cytochrome oxidoreductase complex cytochrome b subunit/coenzyme F420-reducing hydrogenase delta subunit
LASILRAGARAAFDGVEGAFDRVFSPAWNPFYQLGALGYFFYWIVAVSGIYLYVFFDTGTINAYESVERLTHVQWYAGGVMRSLHRYASDALVVVMLLHLLREFVMDRYRGMRWFPWLTGVPIMWLVYASGVSGYWLVWDKLAQYIAVVSSEWFDWLPIFGEPMARNFLFVDSLGDRFFTLLMFMHIAVPLFLLFLMWIHLLRTSRAKTNPPKGLALGSLIALTVLSLVKPALSQGPADLGHVAAVVDLDWFYLTLYPLLDMWTAGEIWLLTGVSTLVLLVMPWLPPLKQPPPATVHLERCNGCTRCFDDCPFGAVTMTARDDGRPFPRQAIVNTSLCTRCGICVGSCPASTPFRPTAELVTGIDLPGLPLSRLRDEMVAAAEGLSGENRVVVFGCKHGVDVKELETPGVASLTLPCIGMLPPPFIDFLLTRDLADGVLLTGCRDENCYQRLGIRWTEDRVDGVRDPRLRKRVPRERIGSFWAAPADRTALVGAIADFQANLPPPAPPDAALAAGTAPPPPVTPVEAKAHDHA